MEKKEHEVCLRCGRKLKNPQARERGYGAVCYRRQRAEAGTPLFVTEPPRKLEKDSSSGKGESGHFSTLK